MPIFFYWKQVHALYCEELVGFMNNEYLLLYSYRAWKGILGQQFPKINYSNLLLHPFRPKSPLPPSNSIPPPSTQVPLTTHDIEFYVFDFVVYGFPKSQRLGKCEKCIRLVEEQKSCTSMNMDCDLRREIKEHLQFIAAEKTSYACRIAKARNYSLEYMSLIMDFTEKLLFFSNCLSNIYNYLKQRFLCFGYKIGLVLN